MFDGITNLTAFVLGTVFIVLLPGPNSLYVMTVASRHGVWLGYRGAMGIFVGDAVLMVAAATGAASVLKALPWLFTGLKTAGAVYLAWIGWRLLRAGFLAARSHLRQGGARGDVASQAAAAEQPIPQAEGYAPKPFKTALLISLMNPKAILFFVSFFIQFVSPQSPQPVWNFVVLGVIVQLCSLTYLSALIFGGAYLASAFASRPRLSALATAAVGLLFMGFGWRLGVAGLG